MSEWSASRTIVADAPAPHGIRRSLVGRRRTGQKPWGFIGYGPGPYGSESDGAAELTGDGHASHADAMVGADFGAQRVALLILEHVQKMT